MPQTVCGKDGKSKLLNYSNVQISLRTTKHFSYQIISIYLLFLKGKDGKDGQNGEVFNNFSLYFIVKSFSFVSLALTNCNLFSAQEEMVVME